ncbi:DUF1648 domain-containing protein [Chloroflexota bacterium]
MVPAAILILSLVLTAYFYRLLPVDVAYHFEDGAPDKWMSRGIITAWLLVPQFVLTLLAGAVTLSIIGLSTRFPPATNNTVRTMLSVMGNMVAMPQLILGFAMLDIFSYNSYQTHLIPLWVFALIVMGLGGIILGLFFIRVIRQAQATVKTSRSEINNGRAGTG